MANYSLVIIGTCDDQLLLSQCSSSWLDNQKYFILAIIIHTSDARDTTNL